MRSRGPVFALSVALLTFFLLTASSFAIPTFSRQYGTLAPPVSTRAPVTTTATAP